MHYYELYFAVWRPEVKFHYDRDCPLLTNGSDVRPRETISKAHIPADADGAQEFGKGSPLDLNLCRCVPDDLFAHEPIQTDDEADYETETREDARP